MKTCPRSLKEALDNPVKVIKIHWKDFDKGIIDWIELNRPMSLQFDMGVVLSEPIISGTLICNSN
jgi:hypothetical protein